MENIHERQKVTRSTCASTNMFSFLSHPSGGSCCLVLIWAEGEDGGAAIHTKQKEEEEFPAARLGSKQTLSTRLRPSPESQRNCAEKERNP